MGDAAAGFHEGFASRLAALMERHKDLGELDYQDAFELGIRAAEAAAGPVLWAATVGERWPTTTVADFLRVTRQALHKRIAKGSALGLRGRGTTWFPVWQFDLERHEIRQELPEILRAFRDELGSVDPLVIASWATSEQPELEMSPEEWLSLGNEPARLIAVARRTAQHLAA